MLLVLCCETKAVAQASSTPDPAGQTAKSMAVENDNSATQEDKYWLQPGEDPENKLGVPFLKHLVADQEEFFTEPARFRVKDLRWGAPLMAGTAALIASDSWLAKQVPDKPNQLKRSKDISNYSALSLVGVGGGAFLLGEVTHLSLIHI